MGMKKREKRELQEIAGEILGEILAESRRAGQATWPVPEKEEKLPGLPGSTAERRIERRKSTGFFDAEGAQETDYSEEEAALRVPRMRRRDAMDLRLQWQRQRGQEAALSVGGEEGLYFAESGPEANDRLAEQLSEAFCRDARRYDGDFERY